MTIWHLLFYVVMIGLVGDLPGCAFQSKQLDKTLNPWLGKTKADRVTKVGRPRSAQGSAMETSPVSGIREVGHERCELRARFSF